MSERLAVRMWEPVQAHRAIQATVWPQLKAMLMAGHRMVVEVKPETRSLEQNARLWAMLTEISQQVDWYGNRPLRPYGPKCAVKAGLIPAGKRREAPIHAFRRVMRDKRTADMFAEAA